MYYCSLSFFRSDVATALQLVTTFFDASQSQSCLKEIIGKLIGGETFSVVFNDKINLPVLIAGSDVSLLGIGVFQHVGYDFLKNAVHFLSLVGRKVYLLNAFFYVALDMRCFQRFQLIRVKCEYLVQAKVAEGRSCQLMRKVAQIFPDLFELSRYS